MIQQAQDDITQLEEKITAAREKQQLLVKRHMMAGQKLKSQKAPAFGYTWADSDPGKSAPGLILNNFLDYC